ncbi:SAV_2336 N-terminal domain-related protein [Streptomyces sp. MP131-18]|uniref:SAV_2336 N-terminal domain-related protein n=1 Tax=Streptomyces sp. MP131-18 TaxID=1857892 RepID=UPI00097C5784|nr:SAV_2336 N-terminal domain-related protein [Streptomyces sp. MP131-18]ONK12910.1 Flp pilus assembly protein, ATPase CpaE [Streptomyces sp. MP131-18]
MTADGNGNGHGGDPLETALRVLRRAGWDPQPHELLDVLWLATRLPAGTDLRARDAGPPAAEPGDDGQDGTESAAHAAEAGRPGRTTTDPLPPAAAPDDKPVRLHAAPGPGTQPLNLPPPPRTPRRALPVRVPGEKALPDELGMGRALRPLKQRRPSAHGREIDEVATAAALAETRLPDVVLRPTRERWLDLALVVDDGPSMLLWHRLAAELRTVFERMGAFRLLRTYGLDARTPGAARLRRQPFSPEPATLAPSVLDDPSGRTLVVVVSDGMGAAWRDGAVHRAIERWSAAGPVAVVHTLPPGLWDGSGIRAERWNATTRHRGGAGTAWLVTDPVLPDELGTFPGLPVPVLQPLPAAVRPWARFLASSGATAHLPLLLPPRDRPPPRRERGLQHFRDAASPEAYRLAAHLAAVSPVSVPVMRLVRSAVPWRATTAQLAEVFLGGLLLPAHAPVAGPLPAHHRVFDFAEDAKTALLDAVPGAELLRTGRTIGRRLEELAGRSPDFPAWLVHPAGRATLPDRARGFTSIEKRLMKRFGIAPPGAERNDGRGRPEGDWPPLTPEDPERLGRYRLLGRREAGHGTVRYLAEDPDGHPVLVRAAPPAAPPFSGESLAVEAAALTRLGGRNAPTLLGSDLDAPLPWIATTPPEAVAHPDETAQRLGDLLRTLSRDTAAPPLHVLASLHLGWRLASALSLCHLQDVVLGDFSPATVIVTERRVVLAGLAECAVDGRFAGQGPAPVREDNISDLGRLLDAISNHRRPDGTRVRLWAGDTWSALRALVESCLYDDPATRPTAGDVEQEMGRFVAMASGAGPAASAAATAPAASAWAPGAARPRPPAPADPPPKLPGRLRRLAAGPREGAARAREHLGLLRAPLAHGHRVTVAGIHPGAGRATATLALGALFAAARGGGVLAVDGVPGMRDLADRLGPRTATETMRRLAALPDPVTHEDVRRVTARTASGLEVLTHGARHPAARINFAAEYRRVLRIAEHHYALVFTDWAVAYPAERPLDERAHAVLSMTDRLVVCCPDKTASAGTVGALLDRLAGHGYRDLAENALVLLTPLGQRWEQDGERTRRGIESRGNPTVPLPADPHLAAHGDVAPGLLRRRTLSALLDAAALIAGRFVC